MTAQGESHSQFCFMLSVFLVLEGRVTNHVVLEIQKKVYEITYGGGFQEEIYLPSPQNFNVGNKKTEYK